MNAWTIPPDCTVDFFWIPELKRGTFSWWILWKGAKWKTPIRHNHAAHCSVVKMTPQVATQFFPFICIGKQVNVNASLALSFFWTNQRSVDVLFLELPSTSAFKQLSACCCWNYTACQRTKCNVSVSSWFHQLHQVQVWFRLTGHMSNLLHRFSQVAPLIVRVSLSSSVWYINCMFMCNNLSLHLQNYLISNSNVIIFHFMLCFLDVALLISQPENQMFRL